MGIWLMFSYGWLTWCMGILVPQGQQGWQDTAAVPNMCHVAPRIRKSTSTCAVCSPPTPAKHSNMADKK